MKIIGISGRKQSGKNTAANILHGIVLKEQKALKEFDIGANGQLTVLTSDEGGNEGWGEFDIARRDEAFVDYAEYNMWPFVKLYSFADNLKSICQELFDIPTESLWGTDNQKNKKQKHLLWENMPKAINSSFMKKLLPVDAKKSRGWKEGPMTAREFMQVLGTDIMRKIYGSVWVNSTIKKMTQEQSELAIIADVRFPNEAKAIEDAGGTVIRLTRVIKEDNHPSEIALDNYNFKHYIDNKEGNIDALVSKVKSLYTKMQRETC
jgi:hypothetical protein